ncbi:unnamed protein product [Linum tenue]|uniref:Uncharacterized protein n=1 Tax=Linum tenue TaxID=586396 RepID=A0AAV0RXN8_9ROSI|nr:unnamed protein product [Linum tenue]
MSATGGGGGGGQEEDKKPGDQGGHINLKVKGQPGKEVEKKRACLETSSDFEIRIFLFSACINWWLVHV